ncbi:MAG: hypothetical protein ABSC01_02660, partial [Verrucomicrobiota bacterium]
MSTNRLSELIQSSTHPIIGADVKIGSAGRHRIVNIPAQRGKRPVKLICVWLLVYLPYLHNPCEAAFAHKWTNSEYRRAETWQTGCMNLPVAINPIIKFGLNLAEHSKKSITPVAPSLPPDGEKAKRASDATADGSTQSGACDFGYQFLMFSLGGL